jgi:putative glycerol-1-phosphate prenyltransferase
MEFTERTSTNDQYNWFLIGGMMIDPMIAEWKHVFKLDPEKSLTDEALDALCLSGTDAIIVGGSSGVTYDNTIDLLSRIRRYATPCALEVSEIEAVVPGFDLYLVPVVLNALDPEFIVGKHQRALTRYGNVLPADGIVAEGYIIANPDCEAARVASARAPLEEADIVSYARYADRLLRLPIVYLEYSGMFAPMEVVRKTRHALRQAQLVYGGGIDSAQRAAEAAAMADTIVVGNVIYTSLAQALETVKAVKNT